MKPQAFPFQRVCSLLKSKEQTINFEEVRIKDFKIIKSIRNITYSTY